MIEVIKKIILWKSEIDIIGIRTTGLIGVFLYTIGGIIEMIIHQRKYEKLDNTKYIMCSNLFFSLAVVSTVLMFIFIGHYFLYIIKN
jgi:hypothetical protein